MPTNYFSQNPFALPPLAEQKRIVARVDELMALCDALEAQLRASDEVRRALARSAVKTLSQGASV